MFKFGKSVQVVEKAINKSSEALAVFTNVVKQLTEVNQQLASTRESDIERIREIELNVAKAYNQERENEKLMGKINSIIGG